MAKQSISIGTTANDGTGTTLRDGGDLINDNFNEIYTEIGDGSSLDFAGKTVTFTGKTISGSSNTLSNIGNSSLTNSSITVAGDSGSGGISLGGTVTIAGGTNVTTTFSAGTVTIDAGGGDIVNDTTPQLGGNLDLNSNDITGTGNINITGTVTATTFSGSGASLTSIPNSSLDNSSITINGTGVSLGGSINVGDITGVTAGSGLTGGGTTGAVTLNVGAGTGIDVASDSISVDVSDFMSNGSNNRVVTATGTDAMNAEANMTFDGSTLTVTGAIRASGDITAFYTSDKSLKTNIETIENPMDKVKEIKGVYYNWTPEAQETYSHFTNEKEIGVIAQDVEKVLPEMVAEREDGTKAVRYERMCALLIECVKDLQNQITELKRVKE